MFGSVPELIFWHIPSKAYAVVAPWWAIWSPCVGSINKEKVTPQDSEEGMMGLLEKRPSVKVRPQSAPAKLGNITGVFDHHGPKFRDATWLSIVRNLGLLL